MNGCLGMRAGRLHLAARPKDTLLAHKNINRSRGPEKPGYQPSFNPDWTALPLDDWRLGHRPGSGLLAQIGDPLGE